jgi:hypothetical protein
MAGSVLYLCEAAGARILAYGSGISQIGTNYQASVETWDDLPLGEMGVNLFRSVYVALSSTGAFQVGVTPTIDDVDLPEQLFSGAGSGQTKCEAFIGQRGTRISATVRTISRTGDVEIENISTTSVPIRAFP